MSEQAPDELSGITRFEHGSAVPAARPLSDFAVERLGDELVLLDGETKQYHNLNGVAVAIWQACDGVASVESIAQMTGLPVEVVATTIGELGEASLLQSPPDRWAVSMNRRRAAKLIAAGAAGAVGVPVVLSLTAPNSASAVSCNSAKENDTCEEYSAGSTCGPLVCCWGSIDGQGNWVGGPYWRKDGVGFGPSPCIYQ